MRVTVKLFARLRELTGAGSLDWTLAEKATIADLIESLQQEFPKLAEAAPKTIISVNQEFADLSTPLAEGDEVALFPPVSGGSGTEPAKFAITFDPISLDEMAARVVKPETGAVAVFGGVVRNVSAGKDVERLEYEAYEEMAVAKLKQVAAEARRLHHEARVVGAPVAGVGAEAPRVGAHHHAPGVEGDDVTLPAELEASLTADAEPLAPELEAPVQHGHALEAFQRVPDGEVCPVGARPAPANAPRGEHDAGDGRGVDVRLGLRFGLGLRLRLRFGLGFVGRWRVLRWRLVGRRRLVRGLIEGRVFQRDGGRVFLLLGADVRHHRQRAGQPAEHRKERGQHQDVALRDTAGGLAHLDVANRAVHAAVAGVGLGDADHECGAVGMLGDGVFPARVNIGVKPPGHGIRGQPAEGLLVHRSIVIDCRSLVPCDLNHRDTGHTENCKSGLTTKGH